MKKIDVVEEYKKRSDVFLKLLKEHPELNDEIIPVNDEKNDKNKKIAE